MSRAWDRRVSRSAPGCGSRGDLAVRQHSSLRSHAKLTGPNVSERPDNPLTTGDIVHAVNTFAVRSLEGLRVILNGFKLDGTVILQIERGGRFRYITMLE